MKMGSATAPFHTEPAVNTLTQITLYLWHLLLIAVLESFVNL